jgi:hypothetical protein
MVKAPDEADGISLICVAGADLAVWQRFARLAGHRVDAGGSAGRRIA